MLNTILTSFAAKGTTDSASVFQAKPADRPIFNKYYKYFSENGYSEDEARLIADLFQSSADEGSIFVHQHIQKLGKTDSLILSCLGHVELYARPSGTRDNKFICRLSLNTALDLADAGIATWGHTSRHFLEHYLLA